jgi:hypothetical protein
MERQAYKEPSTVCVPPLKDLALTSKAVFKDEIERAMRLNGVTKLDQLDATKVELLDGLIGKRFEK